MSVTAAQALDPWPTVRSGSRGHPVHTLQHLLNQHGHDLDVDGSFGPRTEAEVRSFQSALTAFGVVVDGVVGPVTWRAMISGMVSH